MQTLKTKKEILYINISIAIIITFIFLWTYYLFNIQIRQLKSRTTYLVNQIKKVQHLVNDLNNHKHGIYKLNVGLLSFIQQLSTNNKIDNHIINLQTINSDNNTETVSVKFNSLNLSEILKIIKNIEQYSNLYIKKLSITKQPNSNLANMTIIISKT